MAKQRVIKAIPTKRNGYTFRSRAEARWSIILDELGLEWDYEPEGYALGKLGWYLPDFFVRCPVEGWPEGGYWLEIKGPAPTRIEIAKGYALTRTTTHHAWIAYGSFNNPLAVQCRVGLALGTDFPARYLPFVSDVDIFEKALRKARGARFER
jgi:hypothetical protein